MNMEDELTTAAATGNATAVQYLLQSGAQVNGVNRFGRTALQVMMMGSDPVAQLLLRHGADPNLRDPSTGATPLHDAARTGFVDTVQLLLEFNADPNIRDMDNLRPTDVAALQGHAHVTALLGNLL
ncbi:unnamed protein product [Knipowitschia caucasica]|uniref:Uncharacterized protein n=1 Tax=Knipowitschia caucasica TaxID=637954 RepID=A0AAV2LL45_KNICA